MPGGRVGGVGSGRMGMGAQVGAPDDLQHQASGAQGPSGTQVVEDEAGPLPDGYDVGVEVTDHLHQQGQMTDAQRPFEKSVGDDAGGDQRQHVQAQFPFYFQIGPARFIRLATGQQLPIAFEV